MGWMGVSMLFVGVVGCDVFVWEVKVFYKVEGIGVKFVEKMVYVMGMVVIFVEDLG